MYGRTDGRTDGGIEDISLQSLINEKKGFNTTRFMNTTILISLRTEAKAARTTSICNNIFDEEHGE